MGYIKALVILQFHLARHTMTRGKLVAYFLVGCIVSAALVFAGILGAVFYFLGSAWFPEQPRSMSLLALNLLLLVYVLGWFWGFALEMQRSDPVDVKKMLHFPVPLAIINAINFAVSTIGFTSLFYAASAIGLVAGMARAYPGRGIFALFAAGAFFFAASAWAYYLRGLMAVWMENKRRRRLLMSVLPIFFMVAGFMPMILSNTLGLGKSGEDVVRWLNEPAQFVWVERVSWFLPTGWLALAFANAMAGVGPVAAPAVALLVLGAAGYQLGYRMTRRYCFDVDRNAGAPAASGPSGKLPFTARNLPWLNDDTAALSLAAFLSFTRHPQMRTMLLAPFGMVILLVIMNSRSIFMGQNLGMPIIVVMWPFFMFSAFFFNLFGMDSRGFRAMMMLPTPRYRILLAYHLALLPLAGGMGVIFALLGAWFFSMGLETTAVALLQVVLLFQLFTLAGSYVSIYAPYAIGRNMMRGQRSRSLLLALLMPFVVALLLLPTSLCLVADRVASGWGLVSFPAGIVLSITFIGAVLAAYPFLLRHAGDLLLLREQRILAALQKTAE
jgi:hypothetical protein